MAPRIDTGMLLAKALREGAGLRMTGFEKQPVAPPDVPGIEVLMGRDLGATALEALFAGS